MAKKYQDLINRRFGRLLVIGHHGIIRNKRRWMCKCDCGNVKLVCGEYMLGGACNSCGCIRFEMRGYTFRKHGDSYSKEFRTWGSMIGRCINKTHKQYKDYGGRGIKVCERWLDDYKNFLFDMGRAPEGKYSLDRINNDGNYEPSNCRWATYIEQNNNTRSCRYFEYQGQRLTLSQWARETGINHSTLRSRIGLGKTIQEAITNPVNTQFSSSHKRKSSNNHLSV